MHVAVKLDSLAEPEIQYDVYADSHLETLCRCLDGESMII